MITATPQNHLTQENAICDQKHTPTSSKKIAATKKPSFTSKTPSAISHKTSTPAHRHRMSTPKHRICEQKTPPHRHKTKQVFYQNTTTSSITYGFFHRNTLFSACITEKCNTEYSTEHKIKAKNMNYADRSLHHTHHLRTVSDTLTQKMQYPYARQICQTGITK